MLERLEPLSQPAVASYQLVGRPHQREMATRLLVQSGEFASRWAHVGGGRHGASGRAGLRSRVRRHALRHQEGDSVVALTKGRGAILISNRQPAATCATRHPISSARAAGRGSSASAAALTRRPSCPPPTSRAAISAGAAAPSPASSWGPLPTLSVLRGVCPLAPQLHTWPSLSTHTQWS